MATAGPHREGEELKPVMRYDYGFLPPRFLGRVLEAYVACHEAGKRRLTPRE